MINEIVNGNLSKVIALEKNLFIPLSIINASKNNIEPKVQISENFLGFNDKIGKNRKQIE